VTDKTVQCHFRCPADLLDEVRDQSVTEMRNISQMLIVLIRRGLDADSTHPPARP
jgi:hypothetical protein